MNLNTTATYSELIHQLTANIIPLLQLVVPIVCIGVFIILVISILRRY